MTASATLREQTRDRHQIVEDHYNLRQVVRGDPAPATYARVLGALHTVHAPAEGWLAVALPDLPWMRRAGLLAADLTALGATPPADAGPALPAGGTRAEALGAAYVLEGSRHGGAVLARRLRRHGDPAVAGACRFFAGTGGAPDVAWGDFRARLDAALAPDDLPQAVAAARAVFDALEGALDVA